MMKSICCLPKSLQEIREEAIKTYNWLQFVEEKIKLLIIKKR